MDGIIKFTQQFIDNAIENNKRAAKKPIRWKYCVALEKAGFKASCIPVEHSDDIIIRWTMDGEDSIDIKLSFLEQQLWLDYLEKRTVEDDNV